MGCEAPPVWIGALPSATSISRLSCIFQVLFKIKYRSSTAGGSPWPRVNSLNRLVSLLKWVGGPEGGILSRGRPAEVRRHGAATEELGAAGIGFPPPTSYAFSDLIAIQTLIKLNENRIRSTQINKALASLRKKLDWVKQPLSELRVVSDGKKITVHVAGQKMEAISGQILFDFEAAGLSGVRAFPERRQTADAHARIRSVVPERAGTGRDRRACR